MRIPMLRRLQASLPCPPSRSTGAARRYVVCVCVSVCVSVCVPLTVEFLHLQIDELVGADAAKLTALFQKHDH